MFVRKKTIEVQFQSTSRYKLLRYIMQFTRSDKITTSKKFLINSSHPFDYF